MCRSWTSHMLEHTSSRNQRSCVTTSSAPWPSRQRVFRWLASQLMARTSRWFVGSSSMTTSYSPTSKRARSTRRRCPPDNVPIGAFQGMSPAMPAMIERMRASPAHSYSGRSPTIESPTVASSCSASRWPSSPTVTPFVRMTRPRSGSMSPASMPMSVDFPSPLRPTMPMRSPSFMPRDSSSKTVLEGKSIPAFSQPRRNAIMRHCTRWRAASCAVYANCAIAAHSTRGGWGGQDMERI